MGLAMGTQEPAARAMPPPCPVDLGSTLSTPNLVVSSAGFCANPVPQDTPQIQGGQSVEERRVNTPDVYKWFVEGIERGAKTAGHATAVQADVEDSAVPEVVVGGDSGIIENASGGSGAGGSELHERMVNAPVPELGFQCPPEAGIKPGAKKSSVEVSIELSTPTQDGVP